MVFGLFFLTLDTLGQARTPLPQLCFPNRAELVNLGQLLPRFPATSSRLQYQFASFESVTTANACLNIPKRTELDSRLLLHRSRAPVLVSTRSDSSNSEWERIQQLGIRLDHPKETLPLRDVSEPQSSKTRTVPNRRVAMRP